MPASDGTAPPSCPVGAHVTVAGGLATGAIPYTGEVGAEAVQVFVSNARGWAPRPADPRQDEEFRAHMEARGIPVFVHAPYLVNLGSPTPETLRASIDSVRYTLRRGREVGARGVVVHTGSSVTNPDRTAAIRQVREHLLPLLDAIPYDGPDVLLEPMAGQGRTLCATVDDLGPYLAALDHHPRVGICLDTCHAFAAGHDLTAPGGVDAMLSALVATIGAGRLQLVHANDSRDACGSCRDRHENIGKGCIGEGPFGELLRHPVVRGVPVVVETPGKAADHRHDVETLKRLRAPSPTLEKSA